MQEDERCPTCSLPRQWVKARSLYLRCYACKPARSKTGESKSCELCGRAFYVSAASMRQGRGRFCTRVCQNRARMVPAPDGHKHCGICGEIKQLDDFAKNSATHDGRQSRCRSCQASWGAEYERRPGVLEA